MKFVAVGELKDKTFLSPLFFFFNLRRKTLEIPTSAQERSIDRDYDKAIASYYDSWVPKPHLPSVYAWWNGQQKHSSRQVLETKNPKLSNKRQTMSKINQ